MRYIRSVFFLLVLFLATMTALAAQSNDRDTALITKLKERDKQIKSILKGHEGNKVEGELKDKLTALINETIDLKEMGKMALGEQVATFSTEELAEFYSLFF